MAGYIGSRASVVSSGAERKKTFAITTTTTVLSGLSYTPQQVHVFHNGVRLVDGTDFTATDGASLTLTSAAQSGDEVVVISYATFQVADAYTKAEADSEFVSVAGDTMTGSLIVGGAGPFSSRVAVKTDGIEDALVLYHPSVTTGAKILFADNIYNAAIRSTPDGVGKTGLAFDVHQSEKMRIDSAGRVTMPYQPFFKARSQPSVNITTQGQLLPFDVVDKNIGNHYNNSTFTFTAPVNGSYVFNVMLFTPPNQTSFDYFYINGVRQTSIEQNHAPTGYTNRSDVFVVYLVAGDAVSMVHWLGTTHLNGSFAGPHSYFSGYLLG